MSSTSVKEELPLVAFRVSCILAVFVSGYLVHATRAWPYPVVEDGIAALRDIAGNAAMYMGWEPPNLMALPAPNDHKGLARHDPKKVSGGLVFMTGMIDQGQAATLVANDGKEVHRWSLSYMKLFPDMSHIQPPTARPLTDWNTLIHGAMPLPDGSVVANFDGWGMARVDKCGATMWTLPLMTHHSLSMAEDGTFWTPSHLYHVESIERLPLHRGPFYEDQLLQVSQDGKVLREISLPEVIKKNNLEGLTFATGLERVSTEDPDYMHLNDIDILTKDVAAAFPDFEAGDLAISLRNVNLVFVLDPDTLEIKWYQVGPWLRQHDPDFLPDGTISIYDNRKDETLRGTRFLGSSIMKIEPRSRSIEIAYKQAKTDTDPGFYTFIMGKHQYQANGNIMIAQPTYGRAFEVTKEGEVVWDYYNRFDETRAALLTEATRYPESYFNVKDWSCKQKGPAQ